MEAQLRKVFGHDPLPICADQVTVNITGDASLHRVVTLATASPEDLKLVRNLFPAALEARDEFGCNRSECLLTLNAKAEFPRSVSYEFDSSAPPRVTTIWLQVIKGR